MRTFEYRLYPTRAQRQQLMACLIASRALYNEMLEMLRAQYDADGAFPTKYDLTARFTMQKCSRCGEYVQKSLSVCTHLCPSCGLVEDRDVNAAKNIVQAGAPPSGTGADGSPVELRSPRL